MAPYTTTIYYVFSTIAQTLAAIVAILGAFVVVRLSDLSKRLQELLVGLRCYVPYHDAFDACLSESDFESAISQIPEDNIGDDHIFLEICHRTVDERKALYSLLLRTFLITGLVISFSVVSLVFAEPLGAGGVLTWIWFSLGLIGLTLSFIVVGALLVRLSQSKLRRRRPRRRISSKLRTSPDGTEMKIETLASVVTLFSGLLTVLYSSGEYVAWDLLIGVLILFVCVAYRTTLLADTRSRFLTRVGVGIASMICLMVVLTAVYPSVAYHIQDFSFLGIDGTFLVATGFFLLSLVVYRPRVDQQTLETVDKAPSKATTSDD